jgi:YebC/PmpR family DNA-binding regulatory protein
MSGHSKWATTKRHKWAVDAKRSNKFTKHAKLIALAAQKGGDPEMNSALRLAVEKARADNMPNANIENAIKKGTGELKDGARIEELYYEAYGPGGVALYIQALTDNKNRTAANIRKILSDHGGSLAASGSVAYLFEKQAVFVLTVGTELNLDDVILDLIDQGASDVDTIEGELLIKADYTRFAVLKQYIEDQRYTVVSAEIRFLPKSTLVLSDSHLVAVEALLVELEGDDDVNDIAINL